MPKRACYYTVTVTDFYQGDSPETVKQVIRVPIEKAFKVAERQLRAGFKVFGGAIQRDNWGGHGGIFPQCYRRVTIQTADTAPAIKLAA